MRGAMITIDTVIVIIIGIIIKAPLPPLRVPMIQYWGARPAWSFASRPLCRGFRTFLRAVHGRSALHVREEKSQLAES